MTRNPHATTPRADLKRWQILNLLSEEFITQISKVYVYGQSGNSALFITTDDMVYAIGKNTCGCLGTKDMLDTSVPLQVDELCGIEVTTFAHGCSPHVLALTKEGQVYCWGNNQYFQLGRNDRSDYGQNSSTPLCTPCLLSHPNNSRVVQIACGKRSSVILADTGAIFAWGDICSSIASGSQIKNHFFDCGLYTHIACGASFFVAIHKTGNLYTWGSVGDSQTANKQLAKSKCTLLSTVTIVKVVCGCGHTLALTTMGTLYVWGSNSAGQLGLNHKQPVNTPTTLNKIGKVFDIAVSNHSDMSVALVEGNQIFVWGLCYGIFISEPMLTTFKHIYDALASCSTSATMHQPLTVYHSNELSILEALRQAFNDPATSDFTIVVEHKPIYVHKVILRIRSDYFKIMFDSHWKESNEGRIEHHQFSYDVYFAFLKYLYTEDVDLPLEDLLELLPLAHMYIQTNLKNICEFKIKQAVTTSNVCRVYHTAIDLNIKELEDWSLKFILSKMSSVVTSEDFFSLSDDLTKQIILKAAEAGVLRT